MLDRSLSSPPTELKQTTKADELSTEKFALETFKKKEFSTEKDAYTSLSM